MRHDGDAGAGLQTEGYIGIYLRCGGLNASRFLRKGQTGEAWSALFQQYMDLWLAELFLTTVSDAVPASSCLEVLFALQTSCSTYAPSQ